MTIHEYQTNRWKLPINNLTKEIDKRLVELWKAHRRISDFSPANEYKITKMIKDIEDLLCSVKVV